MGRSEKDICIKCDKGGEVLACADINCPIAIHAKCMNSSARFDDFGKFYCPYCLFRESFVKLNQVKELLPSKKQALNTFIDAKMTGSKEIHSTSAPDNCDQQRVVRKQMHSTSAIASGSVPTSSKETASNFKALETGNKVQINDQQEVDEHQLEKSAEDQNQDSHLDNSCVAEKENLRDQPLLEETQRNSIEMADEQNIGVAETTATFMNADPSSQQRLKGKRTADPGDSTCRESKPGVENVVTRKRLTRTSTSSPENNNVAGRSAQVKQPSMLPAVLPNGKRRSVLWSEKEEEMIQEGVQKFSATVNKNIPWRKILEFGAHVFHESRNPGDLRDKWKRMCSKHGGRL